MVALPSVDGNEGFSLEGYRDLSVGDTGDRSLDDDIEDVLVLVMRMCWYPKKGQVASLCMRGEDPNPQAEPAFLFTLLLLCS